MDKFKDIGIDIDLTAHQLAMDYWRLCHEFSVIQSTLLILGSNPEQWGPLPPREKNENPNRLRPTAVESQHHAVPPPSAFPIPEYYLVKQRTEIPKGYWAVFSALTNAITDGKLKATVRFIAHEGSGCVEMKSEDWRQGHDKDQDLLVCFHKTPDWHLTTIKYDEIKNWLKSRGFTKGFFFPNNSDKENLTPEYFNPDHECYAPKLAAAVNAWITVSGDQELRKGKTPKQALDVWLRKNADRYKLTKPDGNPNEQGIEEISKVANWKKAGSPKTPG